jgi:hypothetical protein
VRTRLYYEVSRKQTDLSRARGDIPGVGIARGVDAWGHDGIGPLASDLAPVESARRHLLLGTVEEVVTDTFLPSRLAYHRLCPVRTRRGVIAINDDQAVRDLTGYDCHIRAWVLKPPR